MSKVVLPAGIYYIGDPMHVLDKEEWHERVYITDNIYEPELSFWHHKTYWGDGVFYDQDQCRYVVDSASIGVVPIYMFRDGKGNISMDRLGVVYAFGNEFICEYDNGIFTIGDIKIDTT